MNRAEQRMAIADVEHLQCVIGMWIMWMLFLDISKGHVTAIRD